MLTRDLEAYRQYTLAGDFDNSLQFMPPKMFEVVPRDSLKASMMHSMDNEYMTIQLTGLDFKEKKKINIKKAGAYYWTMIQYDGSMRMELKGEPGYKALMVTIFKNQLGAENVQMEGESTMKIALKNKRLIAYKDPASPRWSLIEDKRSEKGPTGEKQKILFETIMPEEVLKAVGNN